MTKLVAQKLAYLFYKATAFLNPSDEADE